MQAGPQAIASPAPAKINLTLHITARRADGWHELVSLVAFAGIADLVSLVPGAHLSLITTGPTGSQAGPDDDNLVLRAARHLRERIDGLVTGTFHLLKRLPVASGMGGGSSDAAAALRLLADANGLSRRDKRVMDAARATGADVPVCLSPKARMMQGVGERLGPALRMPPLFAVLVNPRVPLETRLVFARMGLAPGSPGPAGAHPSVTGVTDRDALLSMLRQARNDMESAACALLPVIADQITMLATAPGCVLARMSGSGASCFGIFHSRRAAAMAARDVGQRRPDWWVSATILR